MLKIFAALMFTFISSIGFARLGSDSVSADDLLTTRPALTVLTDDDGNLVCVLSNDNNIESSLACDAEEIALIDEISHSDQYALEPTAVIAGIGCASGFVAELLSRKYDSSLPSWVIGVGGAVWAGINTNGIGAVVIGGPFLACKGATKGLVWLFE